MRRFGALLALVLALGALAAAWLTAEGAGRPWVIAALCLIGLAGLAGLRRRRLGGRGRAGKSARHVLIDGSNVMHWNKGAPDLGLVRDIAQALGLRGYRVVVIFDANVGYKIADRYHGPAELAPALGLPKDQVLVAPSGTPADGFLLQFAQDQGAPIVTNDRFRDWHEMFPEVMVPVRLIHGGYRDGAPWLRPGKGHPDQRQATG